MTIASLLAESRRAHLDYRMAVRDGRITAAKLALTRAHQLRAEADRLDPTMSDPAWDDDVRQEFGIIAPTPFTERDAHRDLIVFYSHHLNG